MLARPSEDGWVYGLANLNRGRRCGRRARGGHDWGCQCLQTSRDRSLSQILSAFADLLDVPNDHIDSPFVFGRLRPPLVAF